MGRKKYKKPVDMIRYVPLSERPPVTRETHRDIGPCFCGAVLIAMLDPPSVMHSEPVCKRFVDADLLTFVTDLRRLRQGN